MNKPNAHDKTQRFPVKRHRDSFVIGYNTFILHCFYALVKPFAERFTFFL